MGFNPNDHMMKLKGKDYLQVAWRLVWFREDHPDWSLNADCIEHDPDHAIFKAIICDENGIQKSSGHGSESKKDFGDFLEKAETKAIGRALAMLGYGTQFAADELDEGERIVDSPISREKIGTEPPPADAVEPPKTDDGRKTVVNTLIQAHGINNGTFNSMYRAYAVNTWKMKSAPLMSSLTDEQFNEVILAINEDLGRKESA